MKIVFLNVLDAELAAPLRQFLQTHKADTDVFCLQECYTGVQPILHELFDGYGRIGVLKPDPTSEHNFANVILVRDDWRIAAHGATTDTTDTGLLLYATLERGTTVVHLGNVHGLPRPGKLDTAERLQQTREILNIFARQSGIKVVGGDLNVMPDTQSVAMFEADGYRNLIKDYNIKTTRNKIAWDKHPGNELMYSDYVFTKGGTVTDFVVPTEIVSDHQPMIVTLDLDTK